MPMFLSITLAKKLLLGWFLCFLWARYRGRSRLVDVAGKVMVGVFLVASLTGAFYFRFLDHDEAEHLHSAWLVSQGQIPYRDFFQIHYPTWWLLLAPLLRLFTDTSYVPVIARAFSSGITLLIAAVGWRLARKLWQDDARPWTYLLIWGSIFPLSELYVPRPDALCLLLLILSVYCLVAPAKGGGGFLFWLSGVLQGFSFSLSPKWFPLLMVVPFTTFWCERVKAMPRLAWFVLGGVIGVLPLVLYLVHHGLLADFYQYTVVFQRRFQYTIMRPAGRFNLALLFFGLFGAWMLRTRWRDTRDPKLLLLLAFYLVSLIIATLNPLPTKQYSAAPWLVLTAIVASGRSLTRMLAAINGGSAAVTAFGFALLFYPVIGYYRADVHGMEVGWKTWTQIHRIVGSDKCLCFLPAHPLFAENVGVHSLQHVFMSRQDAVVARHLADPGIIEKVIAERPALIAEDWVQAVSVGVRDVPVPVDNVGHLAGHLQETVPPAERARVLDFIEANYTTVHLGEFSGRARNDLLGRMQRGR